MTKKNSKESSEAVYWETVVEDWIERMADQDREDALESIDLYATTTARTLALIASRSISYLCPPGTGPGDKVKLLLMLTTVVVDASGETTEGFLQVTTKRGSRDHLLRDLDKKLPEAFEALVPREFVDLSKHHHWVSCYRNRDIFLTFCLFYRLAFPDGRYKEISPHVKHKGDLWSVRIYEGEGTNGPSGFCERWTTSEVLGELHRQAKVLASKEPDPETLESPALLPIAEASES